MSTAPILAWGPHLASGLAEVDEQHQELVRIVNHLGTLRAQKSDGTVVLAALDELRDYTLHHFGHEEDLLLAFPGDLAATEEHLRAHRYFIESIVRARELAMRNPSDVVDHLLAFLVRWIVHHITGVDARMARGIVRRLTGAAENEAALPKESLRDTLLDSVGNLYDEIGSRTLELLAANHRLADEIEHRRRAEKDQRLAATVFNTVDEALLVCDAGNRIVTTNPSFTRVTGYMLDEVRGKNPGLLSSGLQDAAFYRAMWASLMENGNWQGEVWNRRKTGEIYAEWLSINTVCDPEGRLTHYVAAFSDITERKSSEERIRHLAHYDVLTDLPNRTLFFDRLQQALTQAQRVGGKLALLYLDLDKFKPINDTLGHAIGDQLLHQAARRMQECIRASDTVARFGGDEFIVLLPSIEMKEDAVRVAEKICRSLGQPFALAGHSLSIASSIGIAVYPEHGGDEESLYRNADQAMYRAKASGGNSAQLCTQPISA